MTGRQTQSSGLRVPDSDPCRKALQDALWEVVFLSGGGCNDLKELLIGFIFFVYCT